ncbi:Mec3p SCDLUD_000881 [Saccharomycodes ludwigii]|uniref:Mec3p n=1 Tax=Saccharomycodes ludwigii TaxID=36035 RepID=UPI001E84A69E|nr:hypothetical protein SCDLUD_000881 [Saccharomycodes ludwigii]KAH3903259.1 hypothetical protein SCDLUD_000881 [Saccharomycodes ludwigii]
MRLKLSVNSLDTSREFQVFYKSLYNASLIRKNIILKFTKQLLYVISIPDNSTTSINEPELWIRIVTELLFQDFIIESVRDNNIVFEISLEPLLQALRKYDSVIKQGNHSPTHGLNSDGNIEEDPVLTSINHNNTSAKMKKKPPYGNLEIRLIRPPAEWHIPKGSSTSIMGAINISFHEYLNINNENLINSGNSNNNDVKNDNLEFSEYTSYGGKVIDHSFKIPIRLLTKTQDDKIRQPKINKDNQIVLSLPSFQSEFGRAFSNFMKRPERFKSLQNVQICSRNKGAEFKCIVDELDWFLEISWNGLLETLNYEELDQDSCNTESYGNNNIKDNDEPEENLTEHLKEVSKNANNSYYNEYIDDQEGNDSIHETEAELVLDKDSHEKQNGDNHIKRDKKDKKMNDHSVIIKSRDWKLCNKIYENLGEDDILCVSHDQYCLLHCAVNADNDDDLTFAEISYYIHRSKHIS